MKPKELIQSVTSSFARPMRRSTGFQRLDGSEDFSPLSSRKVRNGGGKLAPQAVSIELTNFAERNKENANKLPHLTAVPPNSPSGSNYTAATGTKSQPNGKLQESFFPEAEFHVYNHVSETLPVDGTEDAMLFPLADVRLAFKGHPIETDSSNLTSGHGLGLGTQNGNGNHNHGRNVGSRFNGHTIQNFLKKHRMIFSILTGFLFVVAVVLLTALVIQIGRRILDFHKIYDLSLQDYSMNVLSNQSWPLQDEDSRKRNISFLKVSKEQEIDDFKKWIDEVDKKGNISFKPPPKELKDPYHPKIKGQPIDHEISINESYLVGQNILKLNLNENRLNISQLNDSIDGILPNDLCYIEPNVTCNATGWYRSFDGKCNHMFRKSGSLYSPFRRIINPQGKWENHSLTIPRAVNVSHKTYGKSPKLDKFASVVLPMWGMFVLQDTLQTATSPANCCSNQHHPDRNRISDNETVSNICNITSAYFFIHGANPFRHEHHEHEHDKCSNKRPIPAQYPSCSFEPRTSFNLATSFIDASNIYGSSLEASDKLRDKKLGRGRLKQYTLEHHFQKHGFLPREEAQNGTCFFKSPLNAELKDCIASGNSDVNLIASVAALNTLFLRQHNRIAKFLFHHNPHWDDEKLFQESRRILIAQIQHITYSEYLPQILGNEMLNYTGLSLESGTTYYREYNRDADPSVSTAYAGAVGYFWYSMIPKRQKLRIKAHQSVHDFIWDTTMLMVRPNFLTNGQKHMEAMVRGMAMSQANRIGLEIPTQMHKLHLRLNNSTQILDIVRLAIEWGRDMDLPPYLEWRKACGFDGSSELSDFRKYWYSEAYDTVSSIYEKIEDVDLIIGMLSETPIRGGRVGPTLGCLLADQFLRFRKGDRYWYEGDMSVHHFTEEQLKAIRKTSLARIICDNIHEISEIQRWPMLIPSLKNPVFSCFDPANSIPKLNFLLWKEKARNINYEVANNSSNNNNNTNATATSNQEEWRLHSFEENDDSISQSASEEQALYDEESSNNEPNTDLDKDNSDVNATNNDIEDVFGSDEE
ncbi:unnamed protein product [Orchesella dallaii]|uniref:Chorion peroxidase n=1 Tax=Orchesella dallaii TaxID=48710 RepID=A0ABP1Q8R1_9HEXA